MVNSTDNSDIFCEFLVRLLGKLEENNIDEAWLVMNNTSLHKTEKVSSLVDQSKHTLNFLPPYSPMMNPIEEMFSKVNIRPKYYSRS